MCSLAAVPLLLLQLAATAGITWVWTAAAANMGGCVSKCGNVDVPYPFGTSSNGCHQAGFEVTCDTAHKPPKLSLGRSGGSGPEVLEISLRNSTVRVRSTVWSFAAAAAGTTSDARVDALPADLLRQSSSQYALSAARNSLVVVGCGFRFQAAAARSRTFASCAPSCPGAAQRQLRHGPCDGAGCCEAPIPTTGGSSSFDVRFTWLEENATAARRPAWVALGASMFVVEHEWWRDRENVVPVKLSLLSGGSGGGNATEFVIPAVLDWALNTNTSSSCAAAAKMPGFGCVSRNSQCLNATGSADGYFCRCNYGYNGNPYVRGGCRGSRKRIAAGAFLAMGVGIGMFLLLLVLVAIFAAKRLKIHKARKMRHKFFRQNERIYDESDWVLF